MLSSRAEQAASEAERASCLHDIDNALHGAVSLADRARLLMCRTAVRSNQWQTREVLEDAVAAMELFDEAGEPGPALEAASLAAGYASRLGELSLAAELATRCILGAGSLQDDHLMIEVANRLGIFCYSYLDFDRAVEQHTLALEAAERVGDSWKVFRQLHNLADVLLVAVRQERAAGGSDGRYDRSGGDRLAAAATAINRLAEEAPPEVQRRMGVQRLQAELLLEQGRPEQALQLLRSTAPESGAIVWAAGQSALCLVEARCLRALGRSAEAAAVAMRAAELAEPSDDHHESMMILDELVAAERAAGDLAGALADALELKRRMWAVHASQTAQLVEQVWTRAALEYERRALEAQTQAAIRSAEEDALTRIGNRRLLERVLAELPRGNPRLALLMADIDHFKQINDTLGHEVGDHVLRALGRILATDARSGQVVVRYGGEEFVFALPSVELGAASDFAERIRLKVSSYPWNELGNELHVTISIGVSCGPASQWGSLLASADRALYLAKQRGRNRVEVSEPPAEPSAS